MTTVHTHSASRSVLADLQLPATRAVPRDLSLTLGLLTGHLTALIVVGHEVILSASGSAELDESIALGSILRVGNARFRLYPDEIEPVRALLAQFPTAAPIGPESAKVASPAAAVSSLGSEQEPLPSALSGGSALDDSTVARVLTSHENY